MNISLFQNNYLDPSNNLSWDFFEGDNDMFVLSENSSPTATVSEDIFYSLSIKDCPNEANSFSIKVGEYEFNYSENEIHHFASDVDFERKQLFESASGQTTITVIAKKENGATLFETSFTCYVVPSKIGEQYYWEMVQNLNQICRSLINDIIGKSTHSFLRRRIQRRSFRSREEEFVAIQQLWMRLFPNLRGILSSPASKTTRKSILATTDRRIAVYPENTKLLLQHGIDPMHNSSLRKCNLYNLFSSYDIPEHRLIKRFLFLIAERNLSCLRGIEKDIDYLESNAVYRKQDFGNGENLYDIEDVPRIRHLKEIEQQSFLLKAQIKSLQSNPFWSNVSNESTLFYPSRYTFQFNAYYKETARIINSFFLSDFEWNDPNDDFFTKTTSRIYEQWVLVQIINAFRKCGLNFQSWDEIIADMLLKQFGLDFQRNTCFKAPLYKNYYLSLRYEPWIFPRTEINKDRSFGTVFQNRNIHAYWSPDILIELQKNTNDTIETVYAIVIDSKYSKYIHPDQRSNVLKYHDIRSTRSMRQIVKQIWLVYIGKEKSVNKIETDEQDFIFDQENGPMTVHCLPDDYSDPIFSDNFNGTIVAKPNLLENENASPNTDVFNIFAKGTLAFLKRFIASSQH